MNALQYQYKVDAIYRENLFLNQNTFECTMCLMLLILTSIDIYDIWFDLERVDLIYIFTSI